MVHPIKIEAHEEADSYAFNHVFQRGAVPRRHGLRHELGACGRQLGAILRSTFDRALSSSFTANSRWDCVQRECERNE